ncbi:hypothetical protein PAPYR_11606 [Paratrimastix pyriformis]|uniref:Right handed beta helix domain-containing protein n=1 Tax=Paratrimastix pyriformis TaxID=342808 RepID=A0ABQ8U676_9EUKA|nr:hypothetical protein PAPYR_11606 [Paratrimastix pyriformis]
MYDRGGQHRVRLGQSHAPVPLHGQRLRGALRSVTMTGFRAEETRWEANLVMLDGGALFLCQSSGVALVSCSFACRTLVHVVYLDSCTGSDLVLAGNWFEGNTATGNGGHRLGTGRACREGHGRPRVRGTWRGALLPSGPQHDPAPLQPARQPLRGRGPGGHPTDQLTVSRWTYSTSSASSPPRSAPPTRAASRRHLIHGRPWDHLPVLASSRASGGAAGARSLTVTDCEFAGSQALRQGGAIAVSTCTTMHLANSSFTANLAVAPTVSPCSILVEVEGPGPGCTLAQNTASDERGAIYYKAGGAASS